MCDILENTGIFRKVQDWVSKNYVLVQAPVSTSQNDDKNKDNIQHLSRIYNKSSIVLNTFYKPFHLSHILLVWGSKTPK